MFAYCACNSLFLCYSDEEFKLNADSRAGAEDIEDYYFACRNVLALNNQLLSYLLTSGGTAGGALVTGRIVLVTSGRKHYQYVKSPAIVVRPPVISTKNSPVDSSIICMVLLPEGYTASDDDIPSTSLKLGDLNYRGRSNDRYFIVHEINLAEVFMVTSAKVKIDSSILLKEDTKKIPGMMSLGNPFAGAQSIKGRQDDNMFTARGKKTATQSTNTISQDTQLVDNIMSQLIKAEMTERKSGVDVLDLRECARNMHHGSSEMEFRQVADQLESGFVSVRQFQCHVHPNLEQHYGVVDRKETLRSRVIMLQHLLSNESLQLFPDFLQRKVRSNSWSMTFHSIPHFMA